MTTISRSRIQLATRPTVWVLTAVIFLTASTARAGDPDSSRIPGYIDGSAFADLADEGSKIVEVNIAAPLLKALSRAAPSKDGEDVGELLRQLQSISAVIVELDKNPARIERAAKLVREMENRLKRERWERLARVRDKDQKVGVFVRNDDKVIDGLVVLVLDEDEGQVVFANIAGVIDLARIGKLGEKLNVPGLDALKEGETGTSKEKPHKKDVKKSQEDPEP